MNNDQFEYTTYGLKASSSDVNKMLEHCLFQLNEKGHFTPVCIWGTHGIGKTELVKSFAKKHGCEFLYIAPAQIEEMGDLIGLPHKNEETKSTEFLPPEWVPKNEGPGILLIDDVNRADDRILRGLMQLLQNNELLSWKMPSKWMFVLTANPEGGDYSVTSMDNAILTRMLHVTLTFKVNDWAQWAYKNGVDERGIAFVLAYPEIVNNSRTTPRSLVQFFESIESIEDFKSDLKLIRIMAEAALDQETAVAFIKFINLDLEQILSAEEILNAEDFKDIESELKKLITQSPKRLDILSVTMTRLSHYLRDFEGELSESQFNNLVQFMLLSFIPNDLRLALAQSIVDVENESVRKITSIPEITILILDKM